MLYMPEKIEGGLEPDEIEALAEEQIERLYEAKLAGDKGVNYAMLRKLKPISGKGSIATLQIANRNAGDYFKSLDRIAGFRDWKAVEGGQIQVRESSNDSDDHGYVVVRPENDPVHETLIRVYGGFPNSVVIMPRRDEPLPHHGQQKDEILKQMELVSVERVDDYKVWLERMRKAE